MQLPEYLHTQDLCTAQYGSRHTKLWVNPVIQSPINFKFLLIAGNITWSAKAEHQS